MRPACVLSFIAKLAARGNFHRKYNKGNVLTANLNANPMIQSKKGGSCIFLVSRERK